MVYLALFLAAKMHVMNKRGYTFKSWILLIPIAAAFLISISRTMDYRHHATDVIAGGIIGALIAWYAYRQFYPPLAAQRSHRPYSPRIAHEDAHITAEENPELEDNMTAATRKGPILPVTKTASSSLENGAGGSNGAYMRNAVNLEPRTSVGDGVPHHYQQQHDDRRFSRDDGNGAYYTNAASPLIPAAAPHASHHYQPQSESTATSGNASGAPFGYPPTAVSGRGGVAETVEPYVASKTGQNGPMFV